MVDDMAITKARREIENCIDDTVEKISKHIIVSKQKNSTELIYTFTKNDTRSVFVLENVERYVGDIVFDAELYVYLPSGLYSYRFSEHSPDMITIDMNILIDIITEVTYDRYSYKTERFLRIFKSTYLVVNTPAAGEIILLKSNSKRKFHR